MKQTKVTLNLDGLDELKKAIGGRYKTRVGILGEKAARQDDTGINNAELGVLQMFGSKTRNIPPRDFLLMPLVRNRKSIIKDMGVRVVKDAMNAKDYKKVLAYLGVIAEKYIQQGFETSGFGSWPPNKASTVDKKGSAKPLIDTSQLRRSITSAVVGRGKT